VEWFILLWLAILLTIAISGLTEEWFILLWLAILLTIAISGLTVGQQYHQPHQKKRSKKQL
jgi:cell division protein FtsW (lipid II flippase)